MINPISENLKTRTVFIFQYLVVMSSRNSMLSYVARVKNRITTGTGFGSLSSHAPTGSYLHSIYETPGHCIPRGDTVTE